MGLIGPTRPIDWSNALVAAPRTRAGGLARRGGAFRRRARGRGGAALAAALARGRLVQRVPAPGAAFLLPATGHLVDRRPGPVLGLLVRHAALLVTLLDVLGLAFL